MIDLSAQQSRWMVLVFGLLLSATSLQANAQSSFPTPGPTPCPQFDPYDDCESSYERIQRQQYKNKVDDIYQAILDRYPTTQESEYHVERLMIGYSEFSVRRDVAFSSDSRVRLERLYREVLFREIRGDERVDWSEFMSRGGTFNEVRTDLENSDERKAHYIKGFYTSILERSVESQESLNSWILVWRRSSNFDQGYSTVRRALASSAEARAKIEQVYQQYLGRPSDPGGMETAVDYMARTGSLQGLRISFDSSMERKHLIVSHMFQFNLGRVPESQQTTEAYVHLGWNGTRDNGVAIQRIRSALIASEENSARINDIYLSLLGRPADGAGLASWKQYMNSGKTLTDVYNAINASPEAAQRRK